MPGLDGTGPFGQGPMTGRGLGLCGGGARRRAFAFGVGRAGIPWGCGRGRVWGGGRGFWGRSRFNSVDEKSYLEDAMKDLEEELNAIRKRLEELEKK